MLMYEFNTSHGSRVTTMKYASGKRSRRYGTRTMLSAVFSRSLVAPMCE